MLEHFDTWKFIAGLGIFLFGMHQLESALSDLTGPSFRNFLRKHTKNKVRSVLSGTFVTAILQSSSVVSLIVLAFVGAGIIELKHALGIIIGSNLGTTFTGWVVATLGFKLSIESFTLPLIGLGGIGMVAFMSRPRIYNLCRLLIGFGFLFLGLDYMKTSIEYLAQNFDLAFFAAYSAWVFFLVGFVFTALIQSSSASMAITLSALHGGIIPFEAAAAMVIGSDLGTTITVILGGIGGVAAKKRVALSHFMFNLIIDSLAFIFMLPLIGLVTEVLGIEDPLIALVVFHSSFNLLGIFIFFPLLGVFARFLNKRFQEATVTVSKFINQVNTDVPEAAIEALQNEIKHLLFHVFDLHLKAFQLDEPSLIHQDPEKRTWLGPNKQSFMEKYRRIKQLEGELFGFYLELQKEALDDQQSQQLSKLLDVTKNALHATKGIKDIQHNLRDLEHASTSSINKLYLNLCDSSRKFYLELYRIFVGDNQTPYLEELIEQFVQLQKNYDHYLGTIYSKLKRKDLNEIGISTVLNVNRELYSSHKALVRAVKDYLLEPERAKEFDNLPVYR